RCAGGVGCRSSAKGGAVRSQGELHGGGEEEQHAAAQSGTRSGTSCVWRPWCGGPRRDAGGPPGTLGCNYYLLIHNYYMRHLSPPSTLMPVSSAATAAAHRLDIIEMSWSSITYGRCLRCLNPKSPTGI